MNTNKAELKLMKLAAKTDHWSCSQPFIYIFYLLPMIFVAGNFWIYSKISNIATYNLCLELNGKYYPISISLFTAFTVVTLVLGGTLLLSAWLVTTLWNERRIFYGIIRRLRGEKGIPEKQ